VVAAGLRAGLGRLGLGCCPRSAPEQRLHRRFVFRSTTTVRGPDRAPTWKLFVAASVRRAERAVGSARRGVVELVQAPCPRTTEPWLTVSR